MNNLYRSMVAGFVATAVISILMEIKTMAGFAPELDLIRMLSAIFGAPSFPLIGWMFHFVMGTIWWGLLFAWFNEYLPGSRQWRKGICFAILAWLLMMITIMPLAGAGFFGVRLGLTAPALMLVLHLVYGAVLGTTYRALLGSPLLKRR
ncbi:MAG: DUF6789 family protein [Pseudomonadota bacterium]